MFTGIVQENLHVLSRDVSRGLSFWVKRPKNTELVLGESVLLDGICTTVAEIGEEGFRVDYMPETRTKTLVDTWETGRMIHYEPSLRVGDTLGGHFVFGHVDSVGEIEEIHIKTYENEARSYDVSVQFPKQLRPLIVSKGSIALDGVSLTVVSVEGNAFLVSLIPHTLERTHLGALKQGERVHLECDMLARYVIHQ